MSDEVALFLAPGTRVLTLPGQSNPKLHLASESARQRWRHSALYPAFRWSAKAYRVALRLRATAGWGDVRLNTSIGWPLGAFLHDCLPRAHQAVVSLGTPGPARKVTVQLWDGPRVVGYLKYAELATARMRLEQEHRVLRMLPKGVGPQVLKFAEFARGCALVTMPIEGYSIRPTLSLSDSAQSLLASLKRGDSYPVDMHPWAIRLRERHGTAVDHWLATLAGARWPVVFQHGDFAPWNLLANPTGNLQAVDWEYGDAQGFPHIDCVYYTLQVAALIRRWRPERARDFAVGFLSQTLPASKAKALVSLAAFEAYQQASTDGHIEGAPLQEWRRAVWQSE